MGVEPSPEFIDVDRTFHIIDGTKPVNADEAEAWSRYVGRTTWAEVLKHKRVVLLAEANSGKTQEFRNQVAKLNASGNNAFFAALEVLGRNNFELALGREQLARFDTWKGGTEAGYFFLDSLDEARLNDISLDVALNAIALALGPAYERATIILSSRGTDWDGEDDLRRINEAIPVETPQEEGFETDPDEALVAFLRKKEKEQPPKPKPPARAILVVALARLSPEQRRHFLKARHFTDIAPFDKALEVQGLTPLTERPGDLETLLGYWQQHGKFGSLREMTEFGIEGRLSERDDRADANLLTTQEARDGAERLAAALTLCKKLTIKTNCIGSASDDAINPKTVLPDWSVKKIRALLRRGLFAPSTYGRARFHHRSSVEYLTGAWFARLLEQPQPPIRAVLDIYISKGFDIETIPPSLRASAAWLAPVFPPLLERIMVLDPLILMAFGDPTAPSLKDRAKLLTHYAQKDAAGAVSDLHIDSQALWMFADPALSPAVHKAWEENANEDFHLDLLRLIERGSLTACADLARTEALNIKASQSIRVIAARAMALLGDKPGLKELSVDIRRNVMRYGPRLAPHLAVTVFPEALSVKQLLVVIAKSRPARKFQVEGFGYVLDRLFQACRTADERKALLSGLADLGRQAPLDEFSQTSAAHSELLDRLASMLEVAIKSSDADGILDELVQLLSIAGRASVDESIDPGEGLRNLIDARPALKQKLFWEDVAAAFGPEPEDETHPFVWWLRTFGKQLWSLSRADMVWLEVDARSKTSLPHQRMAFSALCVLARNDLASSDALASLRHRFSDNPALLADLDSFETPRPESDWDRRFRQRREAEEAVNNANFLTNSASWKTFRTEVVADPGKLDDLARIIGWPGGVPLYHVTNWLKMTAKVEFKKAALEHRRLQIAFGSEVEAAYLRGLKLLWRNTPPERPTYKPSGEFTEKHTALMSVAALHLEATDPAWAGHLSLAEAKLAIEHIVFAERDAPEWLEQFIAVVPHAALSALVAELDKEWNLPGNQAAPFLARFEHRFTAPPELRAWFIHSLNTREVADHIRVRGLNYLVSQLALSASERTGLAQIVRARLDGYRTAKEWEWTASYISLYLNLDPENAAKLLPRILAEQPADKRYDRTIGLIGSLFGMSSGSVYSLDTASAQTLRSLLEFAYKKVDPKADQVHEGSYSSDDRDDAQDGRNRILSSLIRNGTSEAYRAIRTLSTSPVIKNRRRFDQIARGVAEKASEHAAWTEKDVERFETRLVTPIRDGAELLQVACGLLDDINLEFRVADYSLRPLIETAKGEFAVQNWLAWHFDKLAGRRYRTAREKQVKDDLRPDIVLTAASNQEVAIEIKHGGKQWSLADLRHSLKRQLADDYLLPATRRAGIFVVTNHNGKRFWRSRNRKGKLSFAQVVADLESYAAELKSNVEGFIEVAVRGLDASGSIPAKRKAAKKAVTGKARSKAAKNNSAKKAKPQNAARRKARR